MNSIEGRSFSELQLGIRELFRVVVPGAYAIALFKFLTPETEFYVTASGSTLSLVIAAFFLGLVGYALRVHATWWPYSLVFERGRKQLHDEIRAVLGGGSEEDNGDPYRPLYKYFLETKAADLKDRIHYFSSFYYMLVELSFFSLVAVIAHTLLPLLHLAHSTGPHPVANFIATYSVGSAIFVQLLLVAEPRSIPKKWWSKLSELSFVPLLLVVVGLGTLAWVVGMSRSFDLFTEYRVLALLFFFFAFERFGARQWDAVVREQVILVRTRSNDLIQLYQSRRDAQKKTT
jgi:hypothetical protein